MACRGHRLELDYIRFTPVPAPSPALRAELFGSELVLSWPADAEGFGLQYADELPTTEWKQASLDSQVVEDRVVTTIQPAGGQRFFRLNRD